MPRRCRMKSLSSRAAQALVLFAFASCALARPTLQQVGEFAIPEANQAVGVDDKYFYAIDNQAIAKYDKATGKLVKRWKGDKSGPILHMDSALVKDGRIYTAHSNYP